MADQAVIRERDGALVTLTLNRPERRNPLSLETMLQLTSLLAEVGQDAAVRVVVLASTGPAFSAGHDLREMRGRDGAFYEELFAACSQLMLTLHRIPQPVIARVQGIATAAGCQLVAACDLAVAAQDARFATPGVKIGLFCTTPMVEVVRAVGRKRAMELLLTGEPVDAETALQWGLVNHVVPKEELDAATRALASKIADASGMVLGLGKRAFYENLGLEGDEAYEHAGAVMAHNALAADAQEGFAAFLEKREPAWTMS